MTTQTNTGANMKVYLRNESGDWQLYEDEAATARMAAVGIVLHPAATVGAYASVGDRASVGAGSIVGGRASVGSCARVGDRASVGDGASVPLTATCAVIGPLGSEDRMLTGYRHESGALRIATGCFDGTPEEFMSALAKRHGDTAHGRRYRAALAALVELVESLPEAGCKP